MWLTRTQTAASLWYMEMATGIHPQGGCFLLIYIRNLTLYSYERLRAVSI